MAEITPGQEIQSKANDKRGVVTQIIADKGREMVELNIAGSIRQVPIEDFFKRYAAIVSEAKQEPQQQKQNLNSHVPNFIKENRILAGDDGLLGLPEGTEIPQLKKELLDIAHEAMEKGYVLRSDGRYPYADSDYDKNNGITNGVFKSGFPIKSDNKYGSVVHTSPSLGNSRLYPSGSDMPVGWDRRKFLYFIDPSNYKGEIETWEDNGDVVFHGDIKPNMIKYCIEYDRTDRVANVFKNTSSGGAIKSPK